jgi:uncharacterized protein (TIGR03435 family)
MAVIALCLVNVSVQAQDWRTAAGGRQSFEVASVKDAGADTTMRAANFPLTADDSYARNGGHFSARLQLAVYIQFAYKLWLTRDQVESMLSRLPRWVADDYFDIQAQAEGNPTKDQMRLMMQSLLTDRFHLTFHTESRNGKVYALSFAAPGKRGPKLIPHESGPPCDDMAGFRPDADAAGVFPGNCGVYSMVVKPSGSRIVGARNTTPELLAMSLSFLGNLGRPVVNRTGLTGRYDFIIEFTPEAIDPAAPASDSAGATFLQAVREQLGLKLESTEGPVATPVVDHIEKPTSN